MRIRWTTPLAFPLAALASAMSLPAQPAPAAAAAPAPVLAYQGRLLEATLPVTGTRTFTFSILDGSGVERWNSGAPVRVREHGALRY